MRGFYHCGQGMAVIETRHPKAGHITRRRECLVCGFRVTTREVIAPEIPKAKAPIPVKVKLPQSPAARKPRARKYKHDATKLNQMYQTMTLKEVGEKVGLSKERVRQILIRAGYSTRLHYGLSDKDNFIGCVIAQRQAGKTYREIAGATGLSPSTCHKILKDNGQTTKRPKKQPGCPDCQKKPYALGYCRKCYGRHLRQERQAK